MLFRKSAYLKIGGHASVANALVEDVWLARRIKEEQLRLIVGDGAPVVRTRMYSNTRELWQGFSKNIFAGFNFSLPVMSAVLSGLLLLFVYPFIALGCVLLFPQKTWQMVPLLLGQIAFMYAIRILLAIRFNLGLTSALLHPFAVVGMTAIAVNSWRWMRNGGARWKGRSYTRDVVLPSITHEKTSV